MTDAFLEVRKFGPRDVRRLRTRGAALWLVGAWATAWSATQGMARWLDFAPALGSPSVVLAWPWAVGLGIVLAHAGAWLLRRRPVASWILLPFALGMLASGGSLYPVAEGLRWAWRLSSSQTHASLLLGFAAAVATWWLVGIALVVVEVRHQRRTLEDAQTTHGSAGFASGAQVEALGLLDGPKPGGVCLGDVEVDSGFGAPRRERLWDNGPGHVLVAAATRRGKTSGFVVPTALEAVGSLVVMDVKGEIYSMTAGRRAAMGQKVLRFDASAKGSCSINPLLWVPTGDAEVAALQELARGLVDPAGKKDTFDFWDNQAANLLVAGMLDVLYAGDEKSLPELARSFDGDVQRLLASMALTDHDPERKRGWLTPDGAETSRHPMVEGTARALLSMDERTRSSVVASTTQYLQLFKDPVLASRMVGSDFHPKDLLRHPTSLYLTGTPRDYERVRPLLRILIQRLFGEWMTEAPPVEGWGPDRQRVLVLLDEVARLGKMQSLESDLAVIAGYGVRVMVVVQSLAQLQKLYTKEESISQNCPVQVALGAEDGTTARAWSTRLGKRTVTTERGSWASGKGLFGETTISGQEHGRPLLEPDEIMRMPMDRSLVFVPGGRPIWGRRRGFFEDPQMTAWTRLAAPKRSGAFERTSWAWDAYQGHRPSEHEISNLLENGRG